MNYHTITDPDRNNGDGLRVVLWLSGCSHKCRGCQNPQTWNANSGIPFDEPAKEELFRELDKDYISGLTLTGGNPLIKGNLDDVLDLVTDINRRYNASQDIAQNERGKDIIRQCHVLVDGQYIESKRDLTRKWCGSSNQNVIDIQKTLGKRNSIN